MPIHVKWHNEARTIIRYEFEGVWTWDDLYAAIRDVNTMMGSVPYRVDVIITMFNSRTVPSGALVHMRSGSTRAASNWGMGVFVGNNPLVKALLTAFTKVYPRFNQRYAIAASLEEAEALITSRRDEKLEGQPED
jgi:hypothetical protein